MEAAVLQAKPARQARAPQVVDQNIIEIVSDSGEGAQTCGQMFADLSEIEKMLLMRLTEYLEQMAREVNSKTGSQYEDPLYWMTRP